MNYGKLTTRNKPLIVFEYVQISFYADINAYSFCIQTYYRNKCLTS